MWLQYYYTEGKHAPELPPTQYHIKYDIHIKAILTIQKNHQDLKYLLPVPDISKDYRVRIQRTITHVMRYWYNINSPHLFWHPLQPISIVHSWATVLLCHHHRKESKKNQIQPIINNSDKNKVAVKIKKTQLEI